MNPNWNLPFPPIQSNGLPIFRQDHAQYSLFYTPGYLGVVANEHRIEFENQLCTTDPPANPDARNLRRYAANAMQTWQSLYSAPFTPLCLTLYPNNRCNLACSYCFSSASPSSMASREALDLGVIRSAGEMVIKNCQKRSAPFTIVFHGGGEPSLDQVVVDAALGMLEQMGKDAQVPLFRYIASNGVMSPKRARWLASHFDLIGLSCDGPEDIQWSQRPLVNGKNSTAILEQTAQIVHEAGKPISVRVTLTPATFTRQPEIAEYICKKLQPQEIHVEVVYKGGRTSASTEGNRIEEFITHFIEAREVARRYGVDWKTSGSRPSEIHGPYCNVLRDVINLAPGNVATACFKLSREEMIRKSSLLVGEAGSSHQFLLDAPQIERIRQSLVDKLPKCEACFNRFHCVRSCPDYCPLDESIQVSTFRCGIQRLLTMISLQDIADTLWTSAKNTHGFAFTRM